MFGIFKSKSKANNIEEHNIDFDAKLKEAVIKSNGYEIKYCIENGANPNIIHNGSSLLCYMVFSNSSEMVELCLKHGAIATIKNLKYIDDSEIEGEFNRNGFEFYRDKTPIEIAIHKDYIEILHIFIKYKVVDKQLKNWIDKRLFISILDKDISNIEYYLQHGANIYEEIYTNFSVFGLSDPYYDKLKNYDMSSSLSLILEKKDKKIIKSILKYDSTSSELYKWLSTQSNNNVEEFIEYGVDINNLIAHSIIQNDIKMIDLLSEFDFDINRKFIGQDEYKYEQGDTLLSISVKYEQIEFLKKLLKKGVDINKENVLHIACEKQNLKIIKFLVENNANVNLADSNGRTALFNAISATKANKEIIRFLIANGADIHKEDNSGISPLSFTESNKVSLVNVLTKQEKIESTENQNFSKKIVKNKSFENSDEHREIKILALQIDSFKETIFSQSNEIKELQNKLIKKEQDIKTLIDNFMSKINKLEQKFDKQKVVKTKVSLNVPTEKQSIKKDDGVIVKRESFDDF